MDSQKKLIKNIIVFGIGNLGSKLISVILVPLYTYYLSTNEYGTVDLITTTTSIFIPLVSFSMADAVLRFSMDKKIDKSIAVSNSLLLIISGIFISFVLYPVFSYFKFAGNYLFLTYIYLILQIFILYLAQYLRGIGKTKQYAFNGVLLTFSTGVLNIILLVYLKLGVLGYLYSLILSGLISLIYLTITSRIWSKINLRLLDRSYQKSMIEFSLPLIPNALMWSAINSSSRYFILYFIGVSSNGIFAVASKMPLIINILIQIFAQAWQLSAIEEEESNGNSTKLYNSTFKFLSAFLFIGVGMLLIIIKPLFLNIFAPEYFTSWQITPFLLLGAIFSAFSNFLGSSYIANRETKGVFKTSIWGGILSLITNIILIPSIGVIGAGVSSCLSFGLMFLLRYKDTARYNSMVIDWWKLCKNILLILLQTLILFINIDFRVEVFLNLMIWLMIILNNRFIFMLFNSFLKK